MTLERTARKHLRRARTDGFSSWTIISSDSKSKMPKVCPCLLFTQLFLFPNRLAPYTGLELALYISLISLMDGLDDRLAQRDGPTSPGLVKPSSSRAVSENSGFGKPNGKSAKVDNSEVGRVVLLLMRIKLTFPVEIESERGDGRSRWINCGVCGSMCFSAWCEWIRRFQIVAKTNELVAHLRILPSYWS